MGATIHHPVSPGSEPPYLSVVATARNDDHGGNPLRRMQIFVDAWINQAKRHRLPCELILVEWNPPEDREGLAKALRWPRETGPCQVRIIEVPGEIHARYRYASVLPLYQMIAKNVGIRRAQGEFILATNIDIIFSDELMQFLTQRKLEKGRMYRIDRTDVMSDVPVNATLDEQLAYCRKNVIRLCTREGIFTVTPEGWRANEAEDITNPGSGIHFGSGWFAVERWDSKEPFRWIANEAEVILDKIPPHSGILELDVEAGPGVDANAPALQVLDESGSLVAEWDVQGRSKLELVLPPALGPRKRRFRLFVPSGGLPVPNDPRILNFRIFRCDWAVSKRQTGAPMSAFETIRQMRPLLMRLLTASRASHGSVLLPFKGPIVLRRAVRLLGMRGDDIIGTGIEYRMGDGWHELEQAGAEKFRWVCSDAQLAVRRPSNIRNLAFIVEPGPQIGFQPFLLLIRDTSGNLVGRIPVVGVTYFEVALPTPPGTFATVVLTAEGGGTSVGNDGRKLYFRVHACGWVTPGKTSEILEPGRARSWMALTVSSGEVEWVGVLDKWRSQIADLGKPAFLHLSACGDFSLMAREHWLDLRGYAELDLFSMHLDSLLCCAAHHGGAREEVLEDPMRIYHIEHEIGSGWTPEGKGQLYEGLAHKRIRCVSYEEVVWLIAQMRSLRAPVIFNVDDWGLAGTTFREACPTSVTQISGFGR